MRFTLFLFLSVASLAQVSHEITPREVGVNEFVYFVIKIEGQSGSDAPVFPKGLQSDENFQLAGSQPSTSIQTMIANGRASTIRSFTYSFRPQKQGRLPFPMQNYQVGDERFQTEAVTIDVGDETRGLGSRNRPSSAYDDFFNRSRQPRQREEVFVEYGLAKKEYYLGEPIALDVNLFRTTNVRISGQGSSMNLPDFTDFWIEEIDAPSQDRVVTRDGKRYLITPVSRQRLFANKVGELTIPPATFSLRVTVGSGFFADWQQAERRTEPLVLTIKPLPRKGQPAGFNGLVGRFQVHAELDRAEVKAGESVSLKVEVKGRGNFVAVGEMKPEGLAGAFEVFEGGAPTTEKSGGAIVSKSWVYALVPKREGSYQIPVPALAFFDLDTETYRKTEPINLPLNVLPGDGLAPQVAGATPETLMATEHLTFIKIGDLDAVQPRALPHPSRLIQVILAFAVLDLMVFLGLLLRQHNLSRQTHMRPKFALKNFRKATAGLRRFSAEGERYYGELSQAIFNYFGDKWERTGQGISLDYLGERFRRDQVDDIYFQKVSECVEACDLARFTPNTPGSRENLLQKAVATIEEIEGVLP